MMLQPLNPSTTPPVDNLYLDMNGIIHNCAYPRDSDTGPKHRFSKQKIALSIFQYIEKLFDYIKPKKYFFMAVDGVAPRAKMNQQRQRRFRSAQDAEEAKRLALASGDSYPDDKDLFDSNCITPGTEFMCELSAQLKYWIRKKVTEDYHWQQCHIIFSGHDVPGEGEHKIMEFIRGRKSLKNYFPNERHCIYGLDADLIMLALVSHEAHFTLLREEVKFNNF